MSRQPGRALLCSADLDRLCTFRGDLSAPFVLTHNTQRAIFDENRNRRSVDLVLVLVFDDDREAEVWLEVKAGSDYNGDQICAYLHAIAQAPDGVERQLVVLGPYGQRPPTEPDGFEHWQPIAVLEWDELAEAASRPEVSLLWNDMAAFIREQPGLTKTELRAIDESAVQWFASALAIGLTGSGLDWLDWSFRASSDRRRMSILAALERERRGTGRCAVFKQTRQGGLVAVRVELSPAEQVIITLHLTTAYFVPHRVLRSRAVAAAATLDGWRLGGPDDDAVLSTSIDMGPPGARPPVELVGDWVRTRIMVLRDAGLLRDIDGFGNDVPSGE